jgi:hypothetical protein
MIYKILIFESTHHVMKAEQILTGIKMKFDIIPTPKEYSSDCGMAIRINSYVADIQLIFSSFNKNNINFAIHEKEMK